jgi:hypothetical protein
MDDNEFEKCPTCGKNEWKPIPDSLAEHCSCGFVRISLLGHKKKYEAGDSLQKWVKDIYDIDVPDDMEFK